MDGWSLPGTLLTRAFDRLEIAPPRDLHGVSALIEALGRRMPRGSTVKLDAIWAGRRPPGHDPAEVAEGWLDNPQRSWTCWGAATVTAALVRAGGVLDAEVMGVRMRGEGAPPVDIHSVVRIRRGVHLSICDPHFGVGPVPVGGGEWSRPALRARLDPRPQDRFDWRVTGPMFTRPALYYRSLTGPLDSDDVRALCDISVTHSGVAQRPFAQLLVPGGCGTLRAEEVGGPAELRLWVPEEGVAGEEPRRTLLASWAEGMGALHGAATGAVEFPEA